MANIGMLFSRPFVKLKCKQKTNYSQNIVSAIIKEYNNQTRCEQSLK